jgi:hypothetical protein
MRHVLRLQHLRRIFTRVRTKLSVSRPRANHGHTNVISAQFLRQRVAQPVQSPFRCRVSRTVRQRVLTRKRRNIDDVSGARPNHHRCKRARRIVDASQVCIQDLFPWVRRKLVQRTLRSANARIVHQDVDAPERSFNQPSRRLNLRETGHVTGSDLSLPAILSDRSRDRFQCATTAPAQHSSRAHARQLFGNRGANSPAPTGNHGHLPSQRVNRIHSRLIRSNPAHETCLPSYPAPRKGYHQLSPDATSASYTITIAPGGELGSCLPSEQDVLIIRQTRIIKGQSSYISHRCELPIP